MFPPPMMLPVVVARLNEDKKYVAVGALHWLEIKGWQQIKWMPANTYWGWRKLYTVYRHTANGKHSSRSNSVAGASAALFTIHLMLTNTH